MDMQVPVGFLSSALGYNALVHPGLHLIDRYRCGGSIEYSHSFHLIINLSILKPRYP